MAKEDIATCVVRAAEAALARQKYVSLIDVLCGMGLLSWNVVEAWRKGRVPVLFEYVQGSPRKIALSTAAFQAWAKEKGLRSSDARYTRRTPAGEVELRITDDDDPLVPAVFKRHFLAPDLPEPRQRQIKEKLNTAPKPVVFKILRDSKCSQCEAEIEQGDLLLLDA